MANLDIAQLGNPVLRQVAQPVYHVQDAEMQTLINDLLETLRQANGVGIAAPQVGHSVRVLVVASRPNPRYPHAPHMEPLAMINPHIISHSEEMVSDWEGCLSVPGIRGLVPRYKEIEVEYTTPDGKLERRDMSDFVARIFQHEFDHLNGMVFLDRLENTHDTMTDQEYLERVVSRTTVHSDTL
ncbi:peptide deformylase [Oscillatoria sp. FACHB-1407]|uniref:peptide deformylase n=1 Tax=Oscillatoria sp. FACHB-1407 TaxID=2692847 RepID=UPI0016860B98|nr:peptide deformylase [Oscillatoria sp. FACHB-1407]MBD2465954.1 peptide deformylase [Oscillatoria sp. FACHB-1407]